MYKNIKLRNGINVNPQTLSKTQRAMANEILIETIIQCLYEYKISGNYYKKIFNEYVLCLNENATSS